MNIYAEHGDKVWFANPNAGYSHHQEEAAEHLEEGKVYTVERTVVGGWHTDIYLVELPGIPFNSVMFDDYEPTPDDDEIACNSPSLAKP